MYVSVCARACVHVCMCNMMTGTWTVEVIFEKNLRSYLDVGKKIILKLFFKILLGKIENIGIPDPIQEIQLFLFCTLPGCEANILPKLH